MNLLKLIKIIFRSYNISGGAILLSFGLFLITYTHSAHADKITYFESITDKQVAIDSLKDNAQYFKHFNVNLRTDKEVAMAAVSYSGTNLVHVGSTLMDDRDVVFKAVENTGPMLRYASQRLRKDKQVVLAAVKGPGKAIQYADISLQNDREVVMAEVNSYGKSLQYVPERFKNDKEVVMAAVLNHGYALKFASSTLRANREIVLAAIQNHGGNIQFASEALKNDRDIALIAVKNNGATMQYLPPKFRKDKEFSLSAAKKSGIYPLRYQDSSLKNDKDVVAEAVKRNRFHGLKEASDTLKNDREFILRLLNEQKYKFQKASFLQYMGDELKNDKGFILTAMKINGSAFFYADSSILQDKNFAITAINNYYFKFQYNPFKKEFKHFNNDRDVASIAIKNYYYSYKDIGIELKNDKDFILSVLKSNPKLYKILEENMKNDRDIVLAAIKTDAKFTITKSLKSDKQVVMARIRQNNKEIDLLDNLKLKLTDADYEEILQINGYALKYAPQSIQGRKRIVLKAVKQNGLSLRYASNSLRKDIDVIQAAMDHNKHAVYFVDTSIKHDADFIKRYKLHESTEIGKPHVYSKPIHSYVSEDGNNIHVLKAGYLNHYQIYPFKRIARFKVDYGNILSKHRLAPFFVAKNNKYLVIYSVNKMHLLDINKKKIVRSIDFESEHALMNNGDLITFDNNNMITIWDVESLSIKKQIKSSRKWAGIHDYRTDWWYSEPTKILHGLGKTFAGSSLFLLGDKVFLFRKSSMGSHAGYLGEATVFDAATYQPIRTLKFRRNDGKNYVSYDGNNIYLSSSVITINHIKRYGTSQDKYSSKDKLKYDLQNDMVEVVDDDEWNRVRLKEVPLDARISQVFPEQRFYVRTGWTIIHKGKTLKVFDDGEAVLISGAGEFQMTENARNHIEMKLSNGDIVPIDDISFETFSRQGMLHTEW